MLWIASERWIFRRWQRDSFSGEGDLSWRQAAILPIGRWMAQDNRSTCTVEERRATVGSTYVPVRIFCIGTKKREEQSLKQSISLISRASRPAILFPFPVIIVVHLLHLVVCIFRRLVRSVCTPSRGIKNDGSYFNLMFCVIEIPKRRSGLDKRKNPKYTMEKAV